MNLLRDAAVAVFYPQSCNLCGACVECFSDGNVCADCWKKTHIFDGSETLCTKCSGVLSVSEKSRIAAARDVFCHRCDDFHFTAARAVGIYEGALRAAVLELKRKPVVPEKLKDLLFATAQIFPFNQASKIIPVPLHPKRERERGFNQAGILARILAEKTKLPVVENSLVRVVHTNVHRAGMDERARSESVEKAFQVKNPRLIQNEKILLVDDILTSGATASVCAEALKKAGASEVFVLTIARAC